MDSDFNIRPILDFTMISHKFYRDLSNVPNNSQLASPAYDRDTHIMLSVHEALCGIMMITYFTPSVKSLTISNCAHRQIFFTLQKFALSSIIIPYHFAYVVTRAKVYS